MRYSCCQRSTRQDIMVIHTLAGAEVAPDQSVVARSRSRRKAGGQAVSPHVRRKIAHYSLIGSVHCRNATMQEEFLLRGMKQSTHVRACFCCIACQVTPGSHPRVRPCAPSPCSLPLIVVFLFDFFTELLEMGSLNVRKYCDRSFRTERIN